MTPSPSIALVFFAAGAVVLAAALLVRRYRKRIERDIFDPKWGGML
jgi:hypothetical protein